MNLTPEADEALAELLDELRSVGYSFVTVTPETHRRVIARPGKAEAKDLRDILGWSLPFSKELLPSRLYELLDRSGALSSEGALQRCRLRVSSLGDQLYLHSAFPTDAEDSVFFGPDSYRFAEFLRRELPCLGKTATRLVDLGTGSGIGAIVSASLCQGRIVATDINPLALRLAGINARHARTVVEFIHAATLAEVDGPIDLVIANPPYIVDDSNRSYRDGGEMLGARASLDWTLSAIDRLEPRGAMLLYTGSAVCGGRDGLKAALERNLPKGCDLDYREIDPDVFGEELERPAYAEAERIAVVGAVIRKH